MQLTHSDLDTLAGMIADKVIVEMSSSLSVGKWLTYDEAMAYLKIRSRDTLRRWLKDGIIYGHKRTGSWLIDRDSIDKWLLEDKVIY